MDLHSIACQFLPVLAAVAAGNLNFAWLVSRRLGLDLKGEASGNLGATNLARLAGWRVALPVICLEAIKGWALLWATDIFCPGGCLNQRLALIIGLLYFTRRPFWGDAGGKGVAASLGMLFAIHWPSALIALAGAGTLLLTGRPMSLVTLLGALLALVSVGILAGTVELMQLGVIVLLLVFFHWSNIKRMLGGTEPPAPRTWRIRK